MEKKEKFKKAGITGLKILISSLLIFILLRNIGAENLIEKLMTAKWYWVVLSMITFAVSNLLGAFQWHLLLKLSGSPLNIRQVFSYYHVGLFFNNFLFGYVGGDAFRIYDVRKSSGDTTSAISTVFFDRFVGFFTLTSLAMLVSLIWINRIASNGAVFTIASIFLCWIFALFVLFHERFAYKLAKVFRFLMPDFAAEKIRQVYLGMNQFKQYRGNLYKIFLLSVCIQSLRILTHYWAALSVGVHVNVIYFFIFIPIIALAASLPISLGGLGVREQSGVTLFAQISVLAADVVAFELLAYIIGVLATLPGGVIFALRGEKHRKLG